MTLSAYFSLENSVLKEFKEFAMRGNVMDLAVGVIIGAAFGKIVTSLVDDLLMPVVGPLQVELISASECSWWAAQS